MKDVVYTAAIAAPTFFLICLIAHYFPGLLFVGMLASIPALLLVDLIGDIVQDRKHKKALRAMD